MSKRDPMGHYSLLGLTPEASQEDIKSAYEAIMSMATDPRMSFVVKPAQEAYDVLGDPLSRAAYDASPDDKGVETEQKSSVGNRTPPRFVGSPSGYGWVDTNSVFNASNVERSSVPEPKSKGCAVLFFIMFFSVLAWL